MTGKCKEEHAEELHIFFISDWSGEQVNEWRNGDDQRHSSET